MKKLYVCDGNVDGCDKSCCKHLGNGECMHTSRLGNALYRPPREWDEALGMNGKVLIEKVRDDGR